MIKKIFALSLSLQLAVPLGLFSQQTDPAAQKQTEQEIQLMISKTDNFNITISPVMAAILTASVVGLGFATYKIAYFLGDVKGFGRGYHTTLEQVNRNAAAEIAAARKTAQNAVDIIERNANKAVKEAQNVVSQARTDGFKKGVQVGRKQGSAEAYRMFSQNLPKGDNLIYKAAKESGSVFTKQLVESLEALARTTAGKDEVSHLILKLTRQVSALKVVQRNPLSKGGVTLELFINETIKKLESASAGSTQYTKKVINQLVKESSRHMKTKLPKGGIAGGTLAVIIGVGAYFLSAMEDDAKLISNKRAHAEEDLLKTFKETPELLAAKILVYKEMYGLKFISSIVYENQSVYGNTVANQFEVITSEEIREFIASIEDEAKAADLFDGMLGDNNLSNDIREKVSISAPAFS